MSNQSVGCPNYPQWVIIPSRNDTLVFINDVLIASVNAPLSLWAFIANLVVIIAVLKTPSLRIRSNVLLCSLAAADCLTGLIAQPSFICWRFALHYADCHSLQVFYMAQGITFAVNGCSFVMLTPISCDRLYALAWPMQYRAVVKDTKGMILASVAAWVFMYSYVTLMFLLPIEILYLVDIPAAVFVIGIPIICHIAMFLSIRRHNQNIQDMNSTPAQQLPVSLQREKKVARTMALIILILLALLLPLVVVTLLNVSPLTANVLFPWASTLAMMTASVNPVVHLWRNPRLKEAMASLCCCVQLCATTGNFNNGDGVNDNNRINQQPTDNDNITDNTSSTNRIISNNSDDNHKNIDNNTDNNRITTITLALTKTSAV